MSESYNSLTLIKELGPNPKYPQDKSKRICLWQCVCGKTKEAVYRYVKYGATKYCDQCGYDKKSEAKLGNDYGKYSAKHRMCDTGIYKSWSAMKARVNCPSRSNKKWQRDGIVYESRWEQFEAFYSDMHETYFDGAQLDRIDNNGNYCKDNCQWLTKSEHSIKSNTTDRY